MFLGLTFHPHHLSLPLTKSSKEHNHLKGRFEGRCHSPPSITTCFNWTISDNPDSFWIIFAVCTSFENYPDGFHIIQIPDSALIVQSGSKATNNSGSISSIIQRLLFELVEEVRWIWGRIEVRCLLLCDIEGGGGWGRRRERQPVTADQSPVGELHRCAFLQVGELDRCAYL